MNPFNVQLFILIKFHDDSKTGVRDWNLKAFRKIYLKH